VKVQHAASSPSHAALGARRYNYLLCSTHSRLLQALSHPLSKRKQSPLRQRLRCSRRSAAAGVEPHDIEPPEVLSVLSCFPLSPAPGKARGGGLHGIDNGDANFCQRYTKPEAPRVGREYAAHKS